MDDPAASSIPRIPAAGEADEHGQEPAGVSTVEYAMVYQAEKPRLMRYLIQYGARWHDAAQRALMALYEQWDTVRNSRAWLRKVAFREFMRAMAAKELSTGDQDWLGVPLDCADIEALLEQEAMLCAIRQLPPLQRQVFALHFDQLSTDEIAGVLQITAAAVRQNLARARAKLKGSPELAQRGSAAAPDPGPGRERGI